MAPISMRSSGKVRPGDMGFDVIHMNLHKTFSTPHGGGGPGAGAGRRVGAPAAVSAAADRGARRPTAAYRWLTETDLPQSIGRLASFGGNAGVLLRAYVYMRMLGREGMRRVGRVLRPSTPITSRCGCSSSASMRPIRSRRASHEFILTLKRQAQEYGVTAMDVAKRLLDLGFHAPTTYFPAVDRASAC